MNHKTQIARLLRQQQTKAEKKLWSYLRNRKFEDLKFRRQHPLKEYILDFFCEEYGIVIELDGEYHNQLNQKQKDELRDLHLKELGFIVLRFENKTVFEELEIVFQTIKQAKEKQEKYDANRKLQLRNRRKINRENLLTPTLSLKRGSKTVLSTKILSPSQKELLLNANQSFVAYDAITIEFLSFNLDLNSDYLVFTSQNGVKSFLANGVNLPFPEGEESEVRALCVGEKTKSLLEENDIKVIEMANNSVELGQIIAKTYKNSSFLIFSGNLRRSELTKELQNNNIRYKEVEIYHTLLNYKKFDRDFDGVLFFSPSGVQSFIKKNKLENNWAFCIGQTTAAEAKRYTKQVIIANKPTVENVLVQAIKHFRSND